MPGPSFCSDVSQRDERLPFAKRRVNFLQVPSRCPRRIRLIAISACQLWPVITTSAIHDIYFPISFFFSFLFFFHCAFSMSVFEQILAGSVKLNFERSCTYECIIRQGILLKFYVSRVANIYMLLLINVVSNCLLMKPLISGILVKRVENLCFLLTMVPRV